MVDLSQIPQSEIDHARRMLAVSRHIEARKIARPYEWYVPSSPGCPRKDGTRCTQYANQIGFHTAPHTIRTLFPGNGWGKTGAVGAEANAWGHHLNLWQPTPPWPVLMLWVAKLEDAFDKIREQLIFDIFGTSVRWKASDSVFTWPDGSSLQIAFADNANSWKKWQGIPVDLVICDEQPPRTFWREMQMRRRGRRRTKFVIAATATEGDSWMAEEIYEPWRKHHEAQGLSPEEALWVQSHPDIWLWDRGGIYDNPSMTLEDIAWYESRTFASDKERKVRLHGGFESWTGDPVFRPEFIEAMRAWALEDSRMLPLRTGTMMVVGGKEHGQ